MNTTDERLLELRSLLLYEKRIAFLNEFDKVTGIQRQNIQRIKNGEASFTAKQIEIICKTYDINANWVFGTQKNVFND